MLYIYGPQLPARILEEIIFWKQQEAEHTEVIKAIIPGLEQVYIKLLDDWAIVFTETEKAAEQLLPSASSHGALPPGIIAPIEQLVSMSMHQSKVFIQQLRLMMERSAAVQQLPLAPVVLEHIIRESQYFLDVLAQLNKPGSLEILMQQTKQGSSISHEPGSITLFKQDSPEAVLSFSGRTAEKLQPVPIGGHRLPPLPYAYDALEPYIDEKTMRLHHDKHHQSYVDGLNQAEKKLAESRQQGRFDLIKHWERELAFHGAGHYLHTLFWSIMSPDGGGKPVGTLGDEMVRSFGSFDAFQQQFSQAAENVEGSGWAILVWSPRSQRLEILQAEKHQNLSQWDVVPLLALDVWEHAYYLKHQNDRKSYIQDWWKVVHWQEVQARYDKASRLKWEPF
ncbi:Manganese/iron superoxide dismutase-like protein [Paenibacillus algicola]|uniref:superoxide dismutase n=1 Tax=Paenibacillus algicola TaxID=2565926 RepID=A0A4P8XM94_9BACL|nr:Fe-Mn family superoxide dismutase [Paenibacillus algicola]QCT01359.1 Manganese/iron superoxide dismutase-like protein [Paenibacillus algicola]